MDRKIAIQFKNVTKQFPGVKALQEISFDIRQGEVHALLGENGAGKSTLLNILHGVFPPDEGGSISIEEQKVFFTNPAETIKFGIAKVHQEINLVSQLTVGQNITLGFEPHKGILVDFKTMNRKADGILQTLGCKFRSCDSINNLSMGEMQMIAIAKALYHNARIISFDEPTASLSNAETDKLFEIIDSLKKKGITILYVSHKLDEIYRLADRATILRDGKYVLTCDIATTSRESLIKNMVGRDVSSYAVRHNPSCKHPEVVLQVDNLSGNGFENISFKLCKGEILGFAGLVGAKRTEVMRALFGADKKYSGTIRIYGKEVKINSPQEGLKNGIGLLPENRKTQGFIPTFSNMDNTSLASLQQFCKHFVTKRSLKLKNFKHFAELVRLNIQNPEHITQNLSGGNQQKVILAKWLTTDVDILIFDEPTKGVDVGAKSEIYGLMEKFVARGKSIIMVSSELPEIIGMSDRIIVMRSGRKVMETENNDLSEEAVLSYAMEE